MNIAIIPARGGSKRIPQKNIKQFCGKPMIAWSIEEAQKSGLFDHIVVSTDSEKIATVAKAYGAKVPFLRPAELSDDLTPTAPVLMHAIEEMEKLAGPVAYACCLYATAPFIQSKYLVQGLETIENTGAATVFSVTTFAFPILRALTVTDAGQLQMIWPEYELTRSQDLPECYHDAGQFYWLDRQQFGASKKIYSDSARPVVIPRHMVQDIDTLEDWKRAEIIMQLLLTLKNKEN